MVMRSNMHEVRQIREFARSLGLEFRQDSVLSPRIDGGKGPLKERLTPAEVAAADTDDEKFRAGWKDFCTQHTGFTPTNDDLYQCGAGMNTFLIDPYGRMHTCELSRSLAWDVVQNGFARGWYEGVPALREKKRVHDQNCGSCSTYGACSYCVGMAELEGKNPADGNTYFCEITDSRNARLLGPERPTPNGLVQLRKRAATANAAKASILGDHA
jgi:radical SAM protein with 4Fe4S-binding SPASM domain